MTRLLVYSHDTYGLGNLRRMLSVCESLLGALPEATILLLSGSPMIQGFRLPPRLDYVKLPCLTRIGRERYVARTLGVTLEEAVRLRAGLALAAAREFGPDLFLVDKKPCGIRNELTPALEYLRESLPQSKRVLILRDILDAPEETTRVWERNGYHEVIEALYARVLVLGAAEVFDPRLEYRFPAGTAARVRFCGYLRRRAEGASREEVRRRLGIAPEEALVLVTVGGGQDGLALLSASLDALAGLPRERRVRGLLVHGPEMSEEDRDALRARAAGRPVTLMAFSDELVELMNAADAVVSMAGYNTICEILSLAKPAIVVPRVHPVREQELRATRMAARGWIRMIPPDRLTPATLGEALLRALEAPTAPNGAPLDAQDRIAAEIGELLGKGRE